MKIFWERTLQQSNRWYHKLVFIPVYSPTQSYLTSSGKVKADNVDLGNTLICPKMNKCQARCFLNCKVGEQTRSSSRSLSGLTFYNTQFQLQKRTSIISKNTNTQSRSDIIQSKVKKKNEEVSKSSKTEGETLQFCFFLSYNAGV